MDFPDELQHLKIWSTNNNLPVRRLILIFNLCPMSFTHYNRTSNNVINNSDQLQRKHRSFNEQSKRRRTSRRKAFSFTTIFSSLENQYRSYWSFHWKMIEHYPSLCQSLSIQIIHRIFQSKFSTHWTVESRFQRS